MARRMPAEGCVTVSLRKSIVTGWNYLRMTKTSKRGWIGRVISRSVKDRDVFPAGSMDGLAPVREIPTDLASVA